MVVLKSALIGAIAEDIPAAFVLLDADARVLTANVAARQSASEAFVREVHDGDSLSSFVHSENWSEFERGLRTALGGQQARLYCRVPLPAGSVGWYEATFAPLVDEAGSIWRVALTVADVTDRKRTEAALQDQIRYQEALAECSRTLLREGGSEGERQQVLCESLAILMSATNVSRAYVFKNFEDPLEGFCSGIVAEACAPGIPRNLNNPLSQKIPWSSVPEENRRILASGEQLAGSTARLFGTTPEALAWLHGLSILSVAFFPVILGREWWGYVGFDDCVAEREWDDRELQLLRTASEMIGNTLQRWQASSALRERVEQLSQLNKIGRDINTITDLGPAFDSVMGTIGELLEADAVAISLYAPGRDRRTTLSYSKTGHTTESGIAMDSLFPGHLTEVDLHLLQTRKMLTVSADVTDGLPEGIRRAIKAAGASSILAAPLLAQNEVNGTLSVLRKYSARPFVAAETELAETIAGQLARAVENVRLYEEAQTVAVSEERQRLARELHDAVTQSLFTASLIAVAVPRLWDRDPAAARTSLQELGSLIRGALAEMRMLLLELRPTGLGEAQIGVLLRYLTDALIARAKIKATLVTEGDCILSPDLQAVVYRIAQEALNNVAHHADASEVRTELHCQPGQVEMAIVDNGQGFDAGSVPGDRLGLRIMHERAEQVGAALTVTSGPGAGTQVRLVCPSLAGSCPAPTADEEGG